MTLAEVKYNLGKSVSVKIPRLGINTDCTFTGCIIRKKNDGNFFYQAEVQDTKAKSSVLYVRLEDIASCKGDIT